MKHTLIVTCGRTGSTLLQGILNAIDGWAIKGENGNFAYHLHMAHRAVSDAKKHRGAKSSKPTHAWYGSGQIDPDKFRTNLGFQIDEILLSGTKKGSITCVGFKEIRYYSQFTDDTSGQALSDYLDFLRASLSSCRLIFLTRDPGDVAQSGWWKQHDQNTVIRQLGAFMGFLETYSQSHPADTFLIDYKDVVARSKRLTSLFEFLGDSPDEASLDAVLKTPHSYQPKATAQGGSTKDGKAKERLLKADGLYESGDKPAARKIYKFLVKRHKNGKLKRLPLRAARRAGVQAYTVRTANNHKLAFFPMPKVACTSISYLLYEIINGTSHESGNIHSYFKAGSAELNLDRYADYFKFVVVRDPVERFISGFRNRVLYHQEIDVIAPPSESSAIAQDINAFALNIRAQITDAKSSMIHFETQRQRLGEDLGIFDHVSTIKEIPELVQELSKRTGRKLTMGHYQTGGPKLGLEDISDKALDHLIEFYQPDYDLLSDYYSPDSIREKHALKRQA